MRRHLRLRGVTSRFGGDKMKLKTKNKFLKVIILFLLAVLLLDKIKDAFSLLINLILR